MGFSRQKYWSGLPCLPPEVLPNSGIKSAFQMCTALAEGFFTISATRPLHDQFQDDCQLTAVSTCSPLLLAIKALAYWLSVRGFEFWIGVHPLPDVGIWNKANFPFHQSCFFIRASLVAHMVKNLPARPETLVRSLGLEDPPEKEMATRRSLTGCSPCGREESDMTEQLILSFFFLASSLAFEQWVAVPQILSTIIQIPGTVHLHIRF